MLRKILPFGAFAAALVVAPSSLAAQAEPAAQAAGTAEAAAAQPAPPSELQQVTARLGQIQQRAMQDPQIQSASQELNATIQAAMGRLDANYATMAERAVTLKADVAAAQAAEDNARLHELAAEAKELQAGIAAARDKAMADPEVKEKVEAFKVRLFEKMVELDPEAQTLVQRLTELNGG